MKQKKIFGWAGTILKVDLTQKKIQKVPTSTYEPEKFLGGQGLCNKIFWDMGCPKVGPLDPGNPLMVSVGPLTGIPGPFNRAEICGIGLQNYPNPQFTYSGFGGKFPSSMKYAGYDLIVITGKAKAPVYLSICDDIVEIKDASDLWGLDLIETQTQLMENDPALSVLTIGPAGENLSSLAVVATETSSTAGQGGFGAVMGSKNLKAISVKGTGTVKIAHPEAFRQTIKDVQAKDNWNKGAAQLWGRQFLWGGDQVEVIEEKYRKNYAGPYGCPYQCYGFYDVPGQGKGAVFCAHWWYGYTNSKKESAKANVKASLLAQKLGINGYELLTLIRLMDDTIKENIMTVAQWEEFSGVQLPEWLGGSLPEDEFIEALLYSIASGESLFSQGIKRAMDQCVKKVKNSEALQKIIDIEYPAWGYPQHYYGWIGLLLHVALDVRDAGNSTDEYLSFNRPDNVQGIPPEKLGKHFDVPYGMTNFAHAPGGKTKAKWEGVERQTQFTLIMQSLRNSCPICNFASLPDSYFFPPKLDYQIFLSRVLSSVTGYDMDVKTLIKTGERIWNLRRAVIVKFEGRTRDNDSYLDNFYDVVWDDPHDSGTEERLIVLKAYVDKKKFEELKNRYYEIAGWDPNTGHPTRKKLEELDLKDVADELCIGDKK
jgi:aldehyde:ferredoxin oxidoreductase